MITCPRCDGEKHLDGLVKGKPIMLPCSQCGGTGEVPDAMPEWIARGELLRKLRIERNVTLRAAQEDWGMPAATISDLESGRCDNTVYGHCDRCGKLRVVLGCLCRKCANGGEVMGSGPKNFF